MYGIFLLEPEPTATFVQFLRNALAIAAPSSTLDLKPWRSLLVTITALRAIRKTRVNNLITHLHPHLARSRDRTETIEQIIRRRCNDKAAEEVQVVDVLRSNGDFLADSTNKTNNIDQYTANISRVSTPVEPKSEIVRRIFLCRIQILNLKIPLGAVSELFVGDMIRGRGNETEHIGNIPCEQRSNRR
jgi:hypothetical protein